MAKHREVWWCHYHGEPHTGNVEDWCDDHREDMVRIMSSDDVEAAATSR